jgi:peptide methionine sulfoxide reductase MsrA
MANKGQCHFKNGICYFFSRKHRSPDYRDIVSEMLDSFELIKVNMSPKIHFLKSLIDFFLSEMEQVTDENGERFHQTLSTPE